MVKKTEHIRRGKGEDFAGKIFVLEDEWIQQSAYRSGLAVHCQKFCKFVRSRSSQLLSDAITEYAHHLFFRYRDSVRGEKGLRSQRDSKEHLMRHCLC